MQRLKFALFSSISLISACHSTKMSTFPTNSSPGATGKRTVRIFMVGDVMLGRGVDQMLPHQVNPILHEGYIKDARDYLKLAVQTNGPLPSSRSIDYVWGDAITILKEMKPDVKLINLETSITNGGTPWPRKGIHYRMHPRNVDVIKSAGIDCCVLANNHVLDWGYDGLNDTLNTLATAGIKTAGAGVDQARAETPAIFQIPNTPNRLLVFAAGSRSAGVPDDWAATKTKSGVVLFDESSNIRDEVGRISEMINKEVRSSSDLVVLSLHWGGNWGFDPEENQQEFAKALIDDAKVDLIYGHSSHHVKGVEMYKGKLITYGCGDFISDYEGITGDASKAPYRDDLSFMYFVDLRLDDGRSEALTLYPMRLKRMQVRRASEQDDKRWLFENMQREIRRLGSLDLVRDKNDDGVFRLVP